jgi:predicted amidohydrolase YtcJ
VNAVVGERLPEVLDALEAVDRAYPLRDRRWVIEHIGRMRPDDLPRIRALGLMVTTIPTYSLWKDGDAYLDDPDGGAWTLPHRALMAAGLPIAAGTDNVPCSPFWPMWAAIARVERTTGRVLGTEQALDRRQALRLMTIEGARLSFEEDVKGSIEPGKVADLAVLDADPTEVALDALRNVSSLMTVVGGRIVHHRPWN